MSQTLSRHCTSGAPSCIFGGKLHLEPSSHLGSVLPRGPSLASLRAGAPTSWISCSLLSCLHGLHAHVTPRETVVREESLSWCHVCLRLSVVCCHTWLTVWWLQNSRWKPCSFKILKVMLYWLLASNIAVEEFKIFPISVGLFFAYNPFFFSLQA